MKKQNLEAARKARRTALATFLCVGVWMALSPVLASAQPAADEDFHVQVFALNGPACGGPVVFGEECPDVLLPGAELVLQRRISRGEGWEDVVYFTTNRNGYANLVVKSRGRYRVNVPDASSGGIRPAPLPFFLGPVRFRVPAPHRAEDGFRVTPVVVNFDSGIR